MIVHPKKLPKITDFEKSDSEIYIIQFDKKGGAQRHATADEFIEHLKNKANLILEGK